MEQTIFYQLSLVLAVAAGVSLVMRAFRQPAILGYIITGFAVGPTLFDLIHDRAAFESFSQIGITLLLFMVGLGLNVAIIRRASKAAFLTFAAITIGLGGTGFGVAHFLGFNHNEALLTAVALLFSSTIIVVKVLSDKKGHTRLYGQIAIGILLIEDIAATVALLFVSASTGSSTTASDFAILFAKGAGLGLVLGLLGAFVMPRFVKYIAGSQELLFLFALAWALGVASAFWWAGLSIEVGALFAGVSLAHVTYAQEIGTRLKPLRDFFIVLFFIGLGVELGADGIGSAIVPALIFSAVIMLLKPLLTLASLGVLGYTKQTSFKTAVHLSQISEFSIVLIILAEHTGIVGERLTSTITLTALITIALSAYMMKYDDKLYRWLSGPLSIFERNSTKREMQALEHYPLVLLGYHRGGHEFITTFKHMKKPYVVIDYDPEVVDELEQQNINHIYGDVTDLELLNEIGVHRSELVISTISEPATNMLLVSHIMHYNKDALFICHAGSYDEAEALYEKGAAYVILPHFVGSEQINTFLRRNGSSKAAFREYRHKHLAAIKTD